MLLHFIVVYLPLRGQNAHKASRVEEKMKRRSIHHLPQKTPFLILIELSSFEDQVLGRGYAVICENLTSANCANSALKALLSLDHHSHSHCHSHHNSCHNSCHNSRHNSRHNSCHSCHSRHSRHSRHNSRHSRRHSRQVAIVVVIIIKTL